MIEVMIYLLFATFCLILLMFFVLKTIESIMNRVAAQVISGCRKEADLLMIAYWEKKKEYLDQLGSPSSEFMN